MTQMIDFWKTAELGKNIYIYVKATGKSIYMYVSATVNYSIYSIGYIWFKLLKGRATLSTKRASTFSLSGSRGVQAAGTSSFTV